MLGHSSELHIWMDDQTQRMTLWRSDQPVVDVRYEELAHLKVLVDHAAEHKDYVARHG